jgi:hypothetical protein
MHKETTAFHVPVSTKLTDIRMHYLEIPSITFWAKLEYKSGMYGLKVVYARKYIASFTRPIFIELTITTYKSVEF